MPARVQRSGFWSQLTTGKPSFADRPAHIGEDLAFSILALSDTVLESHHTLNSLKASKALPEGTEMPGIAAYILKVGSGNTTRHIDRARWMSTTGQYPFDAYYDIRMDDTDRRTGLYRSFSAIRPILFFPLKLVDMVLRLPVMFFASLQVLLERSGWALQSKYPRHLLGGVGLLFNFIGGVVCRAGVFVTKVVAEACRAPFAVMGVVWGGLVGGVIGLVGLGAKRDNLLQYTHFKSVPACILQGMRDGLHPFAPITSYHWYHTELLSHTKMSLRLPFQPFPDDMVRRNVVDLPWLSISLFMLATALTIAMAFSTFGIGALMGVPVLHAVTSALHLGAVLPMPIALTTVGLMMIGGFTALSVGIIRGVQAFGNDVREMCWPHVDRRMIPMASLPERVSRGTINGTVFSESPPGTPQSGTPPGSPRPLMWSALPLPSPRGSFVGQPSRN